MKSPGHREHPEHKVVERHVEEPMIAEVGGIVLAESEDVIRVDEDGNPPRYYFPRDDVRMDALERSDTVTRCPFKGTAHYFGLRTNTGELDDGVWSYEEPYDEHADLRNRLAFADDKFGQIHVRPAGSRPDLFGG